MVTGKVTASLFLFAIALHVVPSLVGALPSALPSARAKSSTGGSYLVANGTHLLNVELESNSVNVLQSTGGDVIAIHFDATSSQVFICINQTNGRILLTGVNAGDPMKGIVNSKAKLLACAVDWARQQLYWIDSVIQGRGHLMRSNFSGKNPETIDKVNDYKKVRGMVIDPSVTDRTVLYYAGHKAVGKVEIDQQDKVNRTENIVGSKDNNNDNDYSLSLALDNAARKLYWIDRQDSGVYLFDLRTKTSDIVLQAGRPLAIAADQMTVAVIESAAIRTVNTNSIGTNVLFDNIAGLGTDLTAIAPYRTTTGKPTPSSNSATRQPTVANEKSTATASFPTNRPTLHAATQEKSGSKSTKPTAPSSQTETPRLVSGGTKAAPEPEISKGVSSPTNDVIGGKPTDGAGEGNPAEPASSQVFTCECQNGGTCVEEENVCECPDGYEGDLCEVCTKGTLECESISLTTGDQQQNVANDEANAGKSSGSNLYVGVGVAVPILIAVVVVILVIVLRRRSRRVIGKATTDSSDVWANATYDGINAGGTAKANPTYDASILNIVTPKKAESVQVPVFDDQVYEEIPADEINVNGTDDYQEADEFYRGDEQNAAENYESPTSVCATKPPSATADNSAESEYLDPASVDAQTHAGDCVYDNRTSTESPADNETNAGDGVYDNGTSAESPADNETNAGDCVYDNGPSTESVSLADSETNTGDGVYDNDPAAESPTDNETNVTVQDRPLPDEPVYDNRDD